MAKSLEIEDRLTTQDLVCIPHRPDALQLRLRMRDRIPKITLVWLAMSGPSFLGGGSDSSPKPKTKAAAAADDNASAPASRDGDVAPEPRRSTWHRTS